MGLRVPEGMAALEDIRKGVLEEQSAPESWELVDLEENMKKLMASAASPSQMVGDEGRIIEKTGISGLSVCCDALETSSGADPVDGFLREALQNPRDRLTILRLEQEVERFIRNPTQQILEFQPMPSSYLRLAAHRVAQHYFLQSMVVDSGSSEGTRIVARKTAETRFPSLRLVDIPGDDQQEDKAVVMPTMPVKVAIKQRPQRGSHSNGDGMGGSGSKLNPSKSVEERKEEYNKARARIFCNELAGKGEEDDNDLDILSLGESCIAESGRPEDKPKMEDLLHESPPKRTIESPPSVGMVKPEKEKESSNRGKLVSSNSLGSSNGNGGSRVAIFRDREKDRRDPDYDRNTSRYAQRFDPGFGVNVGPYGVQALYAPLVNYNTEFPQLGVPPRGQLHMEPPPPPPIPQQHMRAPWVPPVNAIGYRPSDATLLGHFNPGHMAPMAMYMHAPQFAYPGHAMTYMHPPDRFQQSISQPHPQQQPDTSLNQPRRR